ncbi:MAG: sulfotransferase family 2 domain-containing protein [Desulfofustis sp.]
MLISHRKKFIFTKTSKTAGTSVESFFEQYCMPKNQWSESHAREECVSEAGIIGCRGNDISRSKWYNHMPAKEIREIIGKDIWNSYFKFTVVRNPFDKLISGFHMLENKKLRYGNKEKLNEIFNRIFDRGDPINRFKGSTKRTG